METIKRESERILKKHLENYPDMEPQDMVKLLYQSEFGCGHFIPNEERARAWLFEEWASAAHCEDPLDKEELGGGFVRVHLSGLKNEEQVEKLLEAFLASAKTPCGSMRGFKERLDALRAVAKEGLTAFSPTELEAFLSEYEQLGCPALHHSEKFRTKYRPAYRVVKKDLI